MSVYTVHEPRPRRTDTGPNPDRFVFVRDGFHFWAFLLGPAWMLWHGLWLVLVIYLVATSALFAALAVLGTTATLQFTVGLMIALLVGFEAGSLRRFGLRRWRSHGVVVAADLDSAERRFFDRWLTQSAPAAPLSAPPTSPPARPLSSPAPEVIGLFPEPQSRP
jgi:hypothetical protein